VVRSIDEVSTPNSIGADPTNRSRIRQRLREGRHAASRLLRIRRGRQVHGRFGAEFQSEDTLRRGGNRNQWRCGGDATSAGAHEQREEASTGNSKNTPRNAFGDVKVFARLQRQARQIVLHVGHDSP
jgi:hypothetical protein